MKQNHYHYNFLLKPSARSLRVGSTKAEKRLWCELLRNKNMLGYSFLRQRPFDSFVADFMCKELQLIIEVDGKVHEQQQDYDEFRESRLQELGFSILRFSNEMIIKQLDEVKVAIENWIALNSKQIV